MAVRLTFDGQKLTWPGIGIFKATTGLPDLQWPDKQCVPDAAIPEGNYKLFIQFQGEAPIRNAGRDRERFLSSTRKFDRLIRV